MSAATLLITTAADFAARAHVNDRRKGAAGEPYINHLAEVAALLAVATEGEDAALIAAGYLHDTLEDTATTFETLEDHFGPEVAGVVAEVTDDKSLPKPERKRRQAEMVTKKSRRAQLLKIADKTSNLRALAASPPVAWDRQRLEAYIAWAEEVAGQCRGQNGFLDAVFIEARDTARRQINAKIASDGAR